MAFSPPWLSRHELAGAAPLRTRAPVCHVQPEQVALPRVGRQRQREVVNILPAQPWPSSLSTAQRGVGQSTGRRTDHDGPRTPGYSVRLAMTHSCGIGSVDRRDFLLMLGAGLI